MSVRGGKAALVLSSLLMALSLPAAAQACHGGSAHTKHLHIIKAGGHVVGPRTVESAFYNYDFGSPSCPRANNVQWPVDVIFINNASVDVVNNDLGTASGSFRYGGVFASTEWDG